MYPVPGILGIASLMAGVVILARRRRADELEAKTTL
jgi:LPXTG-motif cell wall-anchored protein